MATSFQHDHHTFWREELATQSPAFERRNTKFIYCQRTDLLSFQKCQKRKQNKTKQEKVKLVVISLMCQCLHFMVFIYSKSCIFLFQYGIQSQIQNKDKSLELKLVYSKCPKMVITKITLIKANLNFFFLFFCFIIIQNTIHNNWYIQNSHISSP